MFRRSRFSIRPNVGTAGRTTATPQEAPPVSQETSETPKDVSESGTAPALADKSVVTPSEKSASPEDGNDQNGEGTGSSAAVQRRKRFSIKPKVAPGRLSALSRTPKSPVKAAPETPVEVPGSDKPTTTSQTAITSPPQGLQSPRRRRPSEESKQSKVQPKPTLIPSDSSGSSAVPLAENLPKQSDLPAHSGKQVEITSSVSQVEDVPTRLPDKVPPSLPDKESIEISEKAKTLVSKSGLSLSPAAFSLSRLLNDPSDLQRLAKARKLRELLRQEMHKEKKIKKAKARAKEFTIDPAKMTMRDLIRYLPVSNPMTSSIEDPASENETIVPPSPGREESPERAQEPEVAAKTANQRVEDEEEAAEAADEEEEEALMVPQVKVAEDGSLIIDEESLTVEVQRAKGPNPAQDRDPIFERGSTTTYSSFRKGTYSKPWSSEETDMFFLAISMVGTDFSMICQLFPHRARSEIKNKFKKEERENAWRIDKAFRERRKLDIEYFSKLLEKILEVQKNRKKLKSLAEKSSRKKPKRKAKGKKAAPKLSDVEEEDEEAENEILDLEEEGEKENEDLCSEEGTPVSRPKKERKRKNRQDASTVEPNDKKNKSGEKSNEQDEACIPEDAEAALPEDHPVSDMSEKTDKVNAAKDTVIKPAKLSRGRAPQPLLPLGRKWGKKPAPPSTRDKDTVSDKGDVSVSDGASEEQVNKDASPVRQVDQKKSANDGISSEDEDATVQPPRPTRYGRMPKPTKPLTYPGKDDAHSSKSETTPASPEGSTASATKPRPKCTAKRGRSSKSQSIQESKKPKLVTLRASQSEYSDEENEKQWGDEEVEEEQIPACSFSKDGIAPVFVPASLRSPPPVISEVEETMEEDVIDFLSSEHTEVSEEQSYNEAAQTLLTIGSLAHVSQSAQNPTATQDVKTGTASVGETSQHQEEKIASKPAAHSENCFTPLMSATSGQGVTETSETVTTVELQNSTDNGNMPITESSDQKTGPDMFLTPQLHSSPEGSKKNSSQPKKGRLSKVKPKPNLMQASRTAQSKSPLDNIEDSTSHEKPSQSTGPASDLFTIIPREEPSTTEEKNTDVEVVAQVEPAATSGQSALEKLTFSEAQFEPSREQDTRDTRPTSESTEEKLMPHNGSRNGSCSNLLTSNLAVPEPQVGQESSIDSAPVQENSNHPAPHVAHVEELPLKQKEESVVVSSFQNKRGQKVKPKPNLSQTSRAVQSKPQTTKEPVAHMQLAEKPSILTSEPQSMGNTIAAPTEAEPACITCPEKPSQSTGPASDLTPSLHVGSTFELTEEQSTTEQKKTDVGVTGQIESYGTTSDQSAPHVTHVEELPLSQKEESVVASTVQTRRGQKVKPKPNLSQTSRAVRSKPQTTKNPVTHLEKLSSPTSKPESINSTIAEPTCITSPEKPGQSMGPASDLTPSFDVSSPLKPTEKLSTTEEKNRDVGDVDHVESGAATSDQRAKPSVGWSSRSEQQSVDSNDTPTQVQLTEKDGKLLASTHCLLTTEPLSCTKLGPAESEKSVDGTNDKGTYSDALVVATSSVTENQSVLTELFVKSSIHEKSTVEGESTGVEVEAGPASQMNRKAGDSNSQPTDDPTAVSDVQSPEHGSTDSKIKSANTQFVPDPKESIQQPRSENDTETPKQAAVPQYSEPTETNQTAAQSTDNNKSESSDSSKSSRKAPQTRRGRLVKPKPILGRRSQHQQIQNTKPAGAEDSGTSSEAVDVCEKPVSEVRPDVQEAVEGAIGQDSPSNDAGSSLGYLTQVPDISTQSQDGSTSITGGTQRHPNATIFTGMLQDQVPADPDEPFFILSLTEIPVCSLGEVVNRRPEPVPYLQETDASEQQQSSVPAEELEAGDGPLSNVSVTKSETDSISVKDTGQDKAACVGSVTENPVDPHDSSPGQSSVVPETVKNNETEHPPKTQRLMGTGRAAKLQVQPKFPRKSQTSETLAAKEAEFFSTKGSELPGPSVQPKAMDGVVTEPQKGGGDHVGVEKQTLTTGKEPEDSGSEAQTAQTRRTGSRFRKPEGFTSVLSDTNNTAPSSTSLSGKAAPKGPKVKSSHVARKQSTPAPVASTSYDVRPPPTPVQPSGETHSTSSTTSATQAEMEQTSVHSRLSSDQTPSTSPCTVEVPVSHQIDSVQSVSVEQEPTSVSQYFLSNIFTEVDDG